MNTEFSELRVRRIVTGHNDSGEAVVAEDEQLAGTSLDEDDGRTRATFFQLWATHEMPVDLGDDAATCQRDGSTTTIIGSGSGSVLRIGVLAPGTRSPMHRTESLDYGICLEGECDMELDGGETLSPSARETSSFSGEPTTSGTTGGRCRAGSPGCSSTPRPPRSPAAGSERAGVATLDAPCRANCPG
jgi:hypothetical protein